MIFKIILEAGLFFLPVVSMAFAQEQEEIVLSTYYPAPYGEYDELRANTHNADTINVGFSTSTSTRSGIVNFKAVSVSPTTGGTAGDLCFDGTEFKYCDTTGGGYKSLCQPGNPVDMPMVTTSSGSGASGSTLVDISGKSGVLLGGNVTGYYFSSVTLTVDGESYTIAADKGDYENDAAYFHLELPGPIIFNDSLKIQYNNATAGVSGTVRVVENP